MGLIAFLKSFTRTEQNGAKVSDVKIDIGGGDIATAEHFSTPGDDSAPLPGDYTISVNIERAGGRVIVGYLDPKNDQKAGLGEKRIYSRKADGSNAVDLWLKADGSVILANELGSFTLQSNGECVINNVTIDPSGNISTLGTISAASLEATNSLKVDNKEVKDHDHDILSGSSAPGPTGPNN